LTRDLSRSQAEIFAFALNAIADGHQLLWIDDGEAHGVVYVGPTEGVAPQ
jgi:hypothetical protein